MPTVEVDTSRYIVDYENGRIRGRNHNDMPLGETFTAEYKIMPVWNSLSMDGEDNNPVFDGIKVYVKDDPLMLDPLSTQGGRSGFKKIETQTNFGDAYTEIGLAPTNEAAPYPADFEFIFTDYDTNDNGDLINPADTSIITNVKTNFKIINVQTGEHLPRRPPGLILRLPKTNWMT